MDAENHKQVQCAVHRIFSLMGKATPASPRVLFLLTLGPFIEVSPSQHAWSLRAGCDVFMESSVFCHKVHARIDEVMELLKVFLVGGTFEEIVSHIFLCVPQELYEMICRA